MHSTTLPPLRGSGRHPDSTPVGDASRSPQSISAAATAGNTKAAAAALVLLGAVESLKIKQAREAIEKQISAGS
ncbi:MAG TPA: hypothetical protein VII98_09565 [Solirubrobacteraceae bacterium]